jgi:mono/diheme cytochrome c family protein
LWKVPQAAGQKLAEGQTLRNFPPIFLGNLFGIDVALIGGMMKRVKNIAITLTAIFLSGVIFYSLASAQGEAQPSDPTAFYKTKCVACHGQKAEKKFDASLTDEQYVDAVMKGKKPEKPPNMPAYGEKGVTAEQAKALVDYMKQLRAAQ